MQTTDVPPPSGATPPPPPPPRAGWSSDRVTAGLRSLRRSRSDRVLAGVCGGIGRSLGLDPLLVRVVVAVLIVFGGAGVLLYAAGWLLLAEDDGRPSVADRAFRGTPAGVGTRRPLLGAVVLTVVVVVAVLGVAGGWDGTVLLVLALVGLFVWLDRRGTTPLPYPSAPTGGTSPYAATVTASGETTGYPAGPQPTASYPPASFPTAASPTASFPTAPPTGGSSAAGATSYAPTPGTGTTPPGYGPPTATWPVPAPVPPRPPRQRSVLLPATLSVALIALGALAAVDGRGDVSVPSAAYPALALAVVGLGLVVGARYGRSRLLIAVGLLLALATSAASAADRIDVPQGGDVNQVVRPALVADIPARASFRTGTVTYDLSALDLASATSPTTMDIEIGAGEIVVVVPPDVDVTVNAHVGVGEVELLGRVDDGVGVDRSVSDVGPDGPGGGTIDLTLDAGVGNLEVRRG